MGNDVIDEIGKAFDKTAQVDIDENVKQTSMAAAMNAFNAAQKNNSKNFQENETDERPTPITDINVRRVRMNDITRYSGIAASVCIVLIGSWLAKPYLFEEPDLYSPDLVEVPTVIEPSAVVTKPSAVVAEQKQSSDQMSEQIANLDDGSALSKSAEITVSEVTREVTIDNGKMAVESDRVAEAKKERVEYSSKPIASIAPSESHVSAAAPVEEAIVALESPRPQPKRLPSAAPHRNKTVSSVEGRVKLSSAAGASPSLSAVSHAQLQPHVLESHFPEQNAQNDRFEKFEQSDIKITKESPVSTFSIDVDTASYSFVRRQLNQGYRIASESVRLEEMINYFDYDYPVPEDKSQPFKPSISVVDSPWAQGKKLVHVAIKGYEINDAQKPKSNLVFLLDVSGSMRSQDKLPLLKQSIRLLLDSLQPEDKVSIVVYAGAAGVVLEPTQAKESTKILTALDNLRAGGSTAGAQGIKLAYQLLEKNFDKDAVNRIILATDGDFNVGISDPDALKTFVEEKRQSGAFLSVLGFGQGNYNDHLMQSLAQNGNGIAAYIDTLSEAQKVLVEEASSTLYPIAKDVKIQVEFNPDTVAEYRLLGYETRKLKREDFNNDKVDAGDIGAGHTVTAIYEITPTNSETRSVDELRYAKVEDNKAKNQKSNEYGFLKMRYKLPNGTKSKLISEAIPAVHKVSVAKQDLDFSIAVAGFAQLLKGSKYLNSYDYRDVIHSALSNKGLDPFGYRTEFVQLVRKAKILPILN